MSDERQLTKREDARGPRANARLVIALVGVLLIVVFAAVNAQSVTVDFVVASFSLPLVIVIVAAALLGGVIDRLMVATRRRRARG